MRGVVGWNWEDISWDSVDGVGELWHFEKDKKVTPRHKKLRQNQPNDQWQPSSTHKNEISITNALLLATLILHLN